MDINIATPKNWQDFEDICFLLWKSIWGDPACHKNGRQGQLQNGVDIYGRDIHDKYVGVQCKGKNGNYGSKLKEKELIDECNNAASFVPKLSSFIMATTSPRDVEIQKVCRVTNESKKYDFSIDVWAWDDIAEEIKYRPQIMDRYYGTIKEASLLNTITIPSTTESCNKLQAFFSRPGLFVNLNKEDIDVLYNLAYELAINAFQHGKASEFSITQKDNKLCFTDNGKRFDPLSLLSKDNPRGGACTIKIINEHFKISYIFDKNNHTEILLPDNSADTDDHETYKICLDCADFFHPSSSREGIEEIVSQIPESVSRVSVDLMSKMGPSISFSFQCIDKLRSLTSPDQHITIYLPYSRYMNDIIINRYKEEERITIKIKK